MGRNAGESSWKPICSRIACSSFHLSLLPECCYCPCSTPRDSLPACSTPSARSSRSSPVPLLRSSANPPCPPPPPPPPPSSHSRHARGCPPRCTRSRGRSRCHLRRLCSDALRREEWGDCRCLRAAVKESILLEAGYVLVEAGVSATASPRHAEVKAGFCANVNAHLAKLICVLKISAFLLTNGLQEGKRPRRGLG